MRLRVGQEAESGWLLQGWQPHAAPRRLERASASIDWQLAQAHHQQSIQLEAGTSAAKLPTSLQATTPNLLHAVTSVSAPTKAKPRAPSQARTIHAKGFTLVISQASWAKFRRTQLEETPVQLPGDGIESCISAVSKTEHGELHGLQSSRRKVSSQQKPPKGLCSAGATNTRSGTAPIPAPKSAISPSCCQADPHHQSWLPPAPLFWKRVGL